MVWSQSALDSKEIVIEVWQFVNNCLNSIDYWKWLVW